ncbi:MAG TPA: ATP-grasp domain-containing protein, partial [Terriglobia bacterium]|nr:ATP-grasp domain-containing protein [Terriglobia bacterium]
LRVASEFHPDAILSEQTDVAVPNVAYVAERLGLPGIGYDVALRATDKWLMRESCRIDGIPTPEYRLVTSAEDAIVAARQIGFPAVVKPADNQSSRGVTKVSEIAAVPAAAEAALAASQSGRVLVEECMVGQESSVESFVIGDVVHVLGICEKIKCAPPYSFDLQLIYPAAFPREVMQEIEEFNRSVIRTIGIKMGFAHAEVMITNGGVRLIEIAARGCGGRVATDLLPELTGVDLLELRLRQALGEQVQMPEIRSDRVGILRFFELPSGTVRRVGGLREAAAVPGVVHVEFTPAVGAHLKPPVSGDQRPGFMLSVANSRYQAITIADKVTNLIAVDVV